MPALQLLVHGGRWVGGFAAVAVLGTVSWYTWVHGKQPAGSAPPAAPAGLHSGAGVSVDTTTPRTGGIDRVCRQPGSIEPIEAADLYSKVSGFLVEQKVDIGYPVKAGDVLARIAVPEQEKQVQQDNADILRAEARVDQMAAAITTAEADLAAAGAAIALAQADKNSKTSFRAYREKQRDRIKDLVSHNAIDAKLADEQEDQYQAALAAELAANEGIGAARQMKRRPGPG